jgi:ankyrin repeat protein
VQDAFEARLGRLMRAARDGDAGVVRTLVEADPALVRAEGRHPLWGGRLTALHVAVENRRLAAARVLLEAGADPAPDSEAYDGWTPLYLAVAGDDAEMAGLLREFGAADGPFEAARRGDVEALRALLDANPGLAVRPGVNRAPPLHAAAGEAVARLLVAHGADPSALDKYGCTAARAAAYAGRVEAGRWLAGLTGERDLHLLVALGDLGAVDETLARDPAAADAVREGIDPGSGFGARPLHVAAALGNLAMARRLLDAGADPDGEADGAATPLHYAAKAGHAAMAALLLEHGADARRRDSVHDSDPAGWAETFGHRTLADSLRRHAAS